MNTTDPFIRLLARSIALFTILASAAEAFFGWPMAALFSLNSNCYTHFFVWQPLTSLFFLPGFDFGFWPLIDVVFVCMLFTMLGSQTIEFLGKKRYLILNALTTILGSMATLPAIYFFGNGTPFSMLYPLLLGHVTIWTMCAPARTGSLWMLFPVSSKWILGLALAGTILKNALLGELALTAAYTASFLFSYVAAAAYFQLSSPFVSLWPLEASLRRRMLALSRFWNWKIMARIRKWRNTTTIE